MIAKRIAKNEKTVKQPHPPVFVDLTNDFAFKMVFATPGHEDALLLLVNCLLPDKDIVSVSLSTQEQVGDTKDDRRGIYDVSCITQNGDYIEIEMQVGRQKDFGDRMVYYSSFPVRNFSGNVKNSEYAFTPIYIIGILCFVMPDQESNDNFMNYYSIRNDNNHDSRLTDHLHFITVELPKFVKTVDQLENKTDIMAYILKNSSKMKEIPKEIQGKGFDNLFELSKFAAMDEREITEYYARQKEIRDRRAERQCAISEGLEQGLKKGLKQGMKQGRQEEKTAMAKAMKAEGLPLEIIQRCSGLSIGEIQAL